MLSLAYIYNGGKPEAIIAKLGQETFAEVIGATRSRVSVFMNTPRKLGYIGYVREMRMRGSLLHIVLHI